MEICTIENCKNKALKIKERYCTTHYGRWKRYGDPNYTLRPNHGLTKTFAYRSWSATKTRTLNKNHKDYPAYGGRGIKLYAPWRKSFVEFYRYMGEAPGKEYTLDRIDNDKGYIPGNVRWATRLTQVLNRRVAKTN